MMNLYRIFVLPRIIEVFTHNVLVHSNETAVGLLVLLYFWAYLLYCFTVLSNCTESTQLQWLMLKTSYFV